MKSINNQNIKKESLYITMSYAHSGVVTAVYNTAHGSNFICLCEDKENSLDEKTAL